MTFVPLNLPHDEQCGVRDDLANPSIEMASNDISGQTIIQQYETRTGGHEVQSLLLTDFVCYYLCTTQQDKQAYSSRAQEFIVESEEYKRLPIANLFSDQVYRLQQSRCPFLHSSLVNVMADPETYYY